MPILRKLAIVAALMPWTCAAAYGQDLAPRAYVITPLHSNALTLTSTYYTGGLQFDGAVPITGATANVSVPILSYYHALNSFGLCKHRRDSAAGPPRPAPFLGDFPCHTAATFRIFRWRGSIAGLAGRNKQHRLA